MRTLVTGAKGSIGTLLVPRLQGEVIATDIEELDVTKPFVCFGADLVYHLAGAKHAPVGEEDPAETVRINVDGTRNVIEACPGARIVLASTCKAAQPETVYGASKLIAERMVLNAGGVVARFYNVRETVGNVFRIWEEIPEDQPLPVAGSCWRYFITTEQAVGLLEACAELPSGRYAVDPGRASNMAAEARRLYPGRRLKMIPPRRGDREREPLCGDHEWITHVKGYPCIRQIVNRHDLA